MYAHASMRYGVVPTKHETKISLRENFWIYGTFKCFVVVSFQTISELGIDSAHQSSATPKSRVTSAVRRRGAYHSVGGYGSALSVGSPSRENVSRSSVPLLHNTGGIFETLESHQVNRDKMYMYM